MKTFQIKIHGIVQGVGFRPYIYKLCTSKKIHGWVNNSSNGVHLNINLPIKKIESFLTELIDNSPKLAKITSTSISEIDYIQFTDFKIVHSAVEEKTNLLLTPDFAMCPTCESELFSTKNTRFNYSFTTCTNCGPRFSIAQKLPYDRETTTMSTFTMCSSCEKEYEDPLNRRYYSQTNSCPNCAIELALFENGELQKNFTNLDYIIEQWTKGKIIAIKGIGGYLLTCDATNQKVIERLRKLKNRPSKPFALMYHDVYELAEDVEMGIGEKLELEEPSAPIVLFSLKSDRMTPLAIDTIAPKLNTIGVMQPYTPLYKLLLNKFKKPIVATSGNLSNSAIIYQDDKALTELTKISDIILLNNREIVIPQDDSVVKYSSIKYYRTVFRRSRGLAPSYINSDLNLPNTSILAMGAMSKSTFTLLNNANIHISQYLGSTNTFEAQENYKATLTHFEKLFQPTFEVILVDKHPDFFSTVLGNEIATEKQLKVVPIQHHKAHFFAVLGENNLLRSNDKILGVIWDGTGLGDDGNIWGGEFFTYHNGKTKRVHHLNEFPFILGDKMPKEPRVSALVMTQNLKDAAIVKEKFSDTEWKIYNKLIGTSTLKSTSIGRLFDAVASIVLDIDTQTYEGEAAMLLENAAYRYFRANNFTLYYSYLKEDRLPENLTDFLIEHIVIDIEKGFEKDFIAAKFHISLAHYISKIAVQQKVKKVAFSGGVFQNQWLIELILSYMKKDFELFFHKELPPNDENISFGQLMHYIYNKN